MGSVGVFIGGKPAARMGDPTAHGGIVSVGCPTVLIGEVAPGAPQPPVMPLPMKVAMHAMKPASAALTSAQLYTMKSAAKKGVPFCEKCAKLAAEKSMGQQTHPQKNQIISSKKSNQSIALTNASKNGAIFCKKCNKL
jgi:hypothetical protein